MDWFDKAKKLKADNPGITYQDIADQCGVSWTAVNKRFHRLRKKDKPKKTEPTIDIPSTLLALLKKESTITELAKELNISERVTMASIEDLRDQGYLIEEYSGKVKLQKTVVHSDNLHEESWAGDMVIRFGAVADTHLCSKWQQLTHLNTLYDIYEREGIHVVYHAGDITEGSGMRQGHEFEVFRHGADAQCQYVIDMYPRRDGITTKFVTGNHDHSSIKQAGHDIGRVIAECRSDMEYLGTSNAKVRITPNCIVEINHPLDGAAYALSYALQKVIDAMSGGEKPNIYLGGHHHKSMYLFYRNIHAFELGTTQSQTPWMRGKRLPAMMGGWIIEVHVNKEGSVTRLKSEFIPFYIAVEDDYH